MQDAVEDGREDQRPEGKEAFTVRHTQTQDTPYALLDTVQDSRVVPNDLALYGHRGGKNTPQFSHFTLQSGIL